MAASIFGAGGTVNVNVNGSLIPQSFTGLAGQTLFTLTNFTYTQGTNSLLVFINGQRQVISRDFLETSTSSFTLVEGVVAGDFVDVIGFPQVTLIAAIAGGVTFTQQGAGAIQRTLQLKGQEVLTAADFGATGNGATDDTAALQAFINACATYGYDGSIGIGTFKTTSTLTLPSGVYISGQSASTTIIRALGCDAIKTSLGSGGFSGISNIQLRSSNAAGNVDDPKTNTGIASTGTNGTHVNNLTIRNVYLRGWNICLDGQYTWNSLIDNIDTINCNYGIRFFGQSVNNSIANSRLLANTGIASLITTKNVADQGEGLMVSNTLMADGTYGVQSDGFLAMHFTNCITDLITDRGFNFLGGVSAFSYVGGWIYAGNYGVYFGPLGSSSNLGNIIDTFITTTAVNGNGVYWGTNCNGLTVGGSITCAAGGGLNYALNVDGGSQVGIKPLYILNGSTALGIRINGTDVQGMQNIVGAKAIAYAVSPIISVASIAALTPVKCYNNNNLITGSVGITSITAAGFDGEIFRFRFAAACAVTDGSNLKLNGSLAAIAATTLVLTCDGTNWYEISRSIN